MRFASQTRYAVRLLLELRVADKPLPIAFLAGKTGISHRTVENVHAVLKRHGVTGAITGPKGGVSLRRSFSDISLGQLVAWFEGGVELSVCCGEQRGECLSQELCATHLAWNGLSAKVQGRLNDISLADVLD